MPFLRVHFQNCVQFPNLDTGFYKGAGGGGNFCYFYKISDV